MKPTTLCTLLAASSLLAGCQAAAPLLPAQATQPASPAQAAHPQTITVFAAASLTEAFTTIAEAFNTQNPGVEIQFNFAGSQQLAQQLAQGAPADVFASANSAQMDAAVSAGRVAEASAQTFIRNRLVVIYPEENPAGLARLQDLTKPSLKLVLAAKEVPVGGYSLQFLEKASQPAGFGSDFMEKVLSNVVSYEENVRAVYSKVALGEADAGIVYATDIPKDDPADVGKLDIPAELNVVVSYPIAPVQDSANPELAASFVEFVLSPAGQTILADYGFYPTH
jgi:molybdate transport system substrate-binding protein